MNDDVSFSFAIDKARSEGRYVSGWAYVCKDKDGTCTDWSGDRMSLPVVTEALHDFMLNARVAKQAHRGEQVGDIVEAVVVDDDLVKALGATTDKRGIWIKMEVHDQQVRKDVVAGRLRMFSVGGRGARKAAA